MFLSLPVTDAPVLDTKVVCNFSSIKTTKGVKYSILKDEWLYKTANDEPFAYELCFFLVYDETDAPARSLLIIALKAFM